MTTSPTLTDSYMGLITQLSLLRIDKKTPKDRQETILTLIITTTDALAATIKYKKVKTELDSYDISGATRYLDKTMNSELLKTFFGDNELSEMERQLKSLTWQINETTKAIDFDWQRLF